MNDIDPDVLTKLAAPITDGTTWTVDYDETQQVWVIRSAGIECVAECFDKEEALALVGMRNHWPALLAKLDEVDRARDAAEFEADQMRMERDELKAKLADPAVKAVVELMEKYDHQYRRAEAAHDAKDEANRRWLEAATKP